MVCLQAVSNGFPPFEWLEELEAHASFFVPPTPLPPPNFILLSFLAVTAHTFHQEWFSPDWVRVTKSCCMDEYSFIPCCLIRFATYYYFSWRQKQRKILLTRVKQPPLTRSPLLDFIYFNFKNEPNITEEMESPFLRTFTWGPLTLCTWVPYTPTNEWRQNVRKLKSLHTSCCFLATSKNLFSLKSTLDILYPF